MVNDVASTTSITVNSTLCALSVSQLREKLKAHGVSSQHCIEKAELQKLLRRAESKAGKVDFTPTNTWQAVKSYHICPTGLQYEMDMKTGKTVAKLTENTGTPKISTPGSRPNVPKDQGRSPGAYAKAKNEPSMQRPSLSHHAKGSVRHEAAVKRTDSGHSIINGGPMNNSQGSTTHGTALSSQGSGYSTPRGVVGGGPHNINTSNGVPQNNTIPTSARGAAVLGSRNQGKDIVSNRNSSHNNLNNNTNVPPLKMPKASTGSGASTMIPRVLPSRLATSASGSGAKPNNINNYNNNNNNTNAPDGVETKKKVDRHGRTAEEVRRNSFTALLNPVKPIPTSHDHHHHHHKSSSSRHEKHQHQHHGNQETPGGSVSQHQHSRPGSSHEQDRKRRKSTHNHNHHHHHTASTSSTPMSSSHRHRHEGSSSHHHGGGSQPHTPHSTRTNNDHHHHGGTPGSRAGSSHDDGFGGRHHHHHHHPRESELRHVRRRLFEDDDLGSAAPGGGTGGEGTNSSGCSRTNADPTPSIEEGNLDAEPKVADEGGSHTRNSPPAGSNHTTGPSHPQAGSSAFPALPADSKGNHHSEKRHRDRLRGEERRRTFGMGAGAEAPPGGSHHSSHEKKMRGESRHSSSHASSSHRALDSQGGGDDHRRRDSHESSSHGRNRAHGMEAERDAEREDRRKAREAHHREHRDRRRSRGDDHDKRARKRRRQEKDAAYNALISEITQEEKEKQRARREHVNKQFRARGLLTPAAGDNSSGGPNLPVDERPWTPSTSTPPPHNNVVRRTNSVKQCRRQQDPDSSHKDAASSTTEDPDSAAVVAPINRELIQSNAFILEASSEEGSTFPSLHGEIPAGLTRESSSEEIEAALMQSQVSMDDFV